MKKYVILTLIVLLAALAVSIIPAKALTKEQICEWSFGGVWNEQDQVCEERSNNWYWSIDPAWVVGMCGEIKDAGTINWEIEIMGGGSWWWWNFVGCSYSALPTGETPVTSGTPVDAYYGNCGINIPNPPLNGTVVLSKERSALPGFVKAACTATYYDFNGTLLPGYGTIATVYINLDSLGYNLFMDEKADIFTYNEADGWRACGATWMELADSDFGRLYCTTTNSTFGLGRK